MRSKIASRPRLLVRFSTVTFSFNETIIQAHQIDAPIEANRCVLLVATKRTERQLYRHVLPIIEDCSLDYKIAIIRTFDVF